MFGYILITKSIDTINENSSEPRKKLNNFGQVFGKIYLGLDDDRFAFTCDFRFVAPGEAR